MPDFGIYAGDTNKTIYLRLRDATTGLAKTGLVFNSAGAVCSYTLPLAARAAITLATQTVTGAHSDGGFVEVDATNCKGLYRLDLPDAAIASGDYTIISIEFDGIIEESMEIPLHTKQVTLAAGAITDASLAGNMEIVFETDFATNYNTTRNAWATNVQDFVGTSAADPFNGTVVAASVTAGVTLAAGAITDASLAGNMEIVFETDFATNYNTTRNAWATNVQDFVGTSGADPFNGTVVAASVTGAVGSVTGHTAQTGDSFARIGAAGASLTDLGGMSTAMKAEVNAEVDTALATTTYAEPGQGLPAATASLKDKIGYLYKAWRNRSNQTSTTYQLFNDDATTVDQKATVSDDGTTTEKGEVATGP